MISEDALKLAIEVAQKAAVSDDKTEERLVEIDGHRYTPDNLARIDPPTAKHFNAHTLGAVINYIEADPDKHEGAVIVRVDGPTSVAVSGPLRADRKREDFLEVAALGGDDFECHLNEFLDHESFMIFLQTHFAAAGPITELIKIVGNITDENIVTAEDDGVSQKVGVKQGAAIRGEETVTNPCKLTPLRSFPEITLDPVPYIVRLKSGNNEGHMPSVALFEADGGAWQLDAVQKIGAYLKAALPKGTVVLY